MTYVNIKKLLIESNYLHLFKTLLIVTPLMRINSFYLPLKVSRIVDKCLMFYPLFPFHFNPLHHTPTMIVKFNLVFHMGLFILF